MNEADRAFVRSLFQAHKYAIFAIIALHIVCVFAQVDAINILKPLLNEGVEGKDMDMIMSLGWILVLLTVISSVTVFLSSYLSSKVATAVSESLRASLMESAMKTRSMDDLNGHIANVMTCLTADVASVQRYVFYTLRVYLPMPFLMVMLFYCAYLLNPLVGSILTLTLSIIMIITFISSRRVYPMYKQQEEAVDRVNTLLREKIKGARPIRAYDGFAYETEKFSAASAELGLKNRMIELNNYYHPNLAIAFMWMSMVIVYVVLSLSFESMETIIDLVLFMQYTTYLVSTLAIVPYMCIEAPRARVCYQRIFEVKDSVSEPPSGDVPEDRDSEYALSIRDVSLKDRFGRKVIKGVSIDLRHGEVMSIVGPNGCGNSMMFSMVMGFMDADGGSILVDGMEVGKVDPAHIRDSMAFAGNSVQLFGGTLRENIDPHGRCTDEDIIGMCRRVGLGSYLESLPEGLDTRMTEDATNVSGGQKLLIVIARALLRDVPLYVFDDCFFSLDGDTKGSTLRAILEVCKGRSVVFVMHDISTCRVSDTVVLMERGQIVDRGLPEELTGRSQLFREMSTEGQREDGTWA
jgi:ATP-binding cassette subfamily B protein